MSTEETRDESTAVHSCEVLVVGAGVSGYCAAIQAARQGCATILLEKDEVLGGNSGPNLGVGITGADRYYAYATETGLIQELQEEAAWVNGFTRVSRGTMPYNISRRNEAVVQSALDQASVRVFKRCYARQPEVHQGRITAVLAEDLAAFCPVRIDVSGLVIEASGDGHIGAAAGAEFDCGSESRAEFGERSAPEERRPWVQGTSLVAIAHRTGSEVLFIPPPGTPEFVPRLWHGRIESYLHHSHGPLSDGNDLVFLYITEAGGDMDTIADDAAIYELLLGQLWAEWNHIKNGPHREQARNWDLLWVSPKAGKRESRRFMGDVVLTQTDLEAGRRFPDDIAYGGHDLDDHQSLGTAGSNIYGHSIPPMYGIPFRSCYSRNIDNLLLAGRLISATHLAHSSTRLMRTGGAIGQAVGLAADLCCRHGLTPRQLGRERTGELQELLLSCDATILGRPLQTGADLAPSATITSSSEHRFADQDIDTMVPLVARAGNLLWDWPDVLERIELHVRNDSDAPRPLSLTVLHARREPTWSTAERHRRDGWNDLRDTAFAEIATVTREVPARFEGWFAVAFDESLRLPAKDPTSDADRLLVSVEEDRHMWWGTMRAGCEICTLVEHSHHESCWNTLEGRGAMRLRPDVRLGEAAQIVDGFHRRFSRGPAHMWMSAPCSRPPHDLVLTWEDAVDLARIEVTFDNLAPTRAQNPWEAGTRVHPMLVSEYELAARQGETWPVLSREEGNHHRFRAHSFAPVRTSQIRLRVLATHGAEGQARVYRIACYVE